MKKLIIILLLTLTTNIFSQEPFYYRIDRSKGLPSNTVFDVFQDGQGFIWFSGSFGLCRYDGSQFLTFEANHSSSKSGTGIKQDKTGRIWYCNFDGKILYVDKGQVCELAQHSEAGFFHFAIVDKYLYTVENKGVAVYDVAALKKKFILPINARKIVCTHGSSTCFYVLTDNMLYVICSPTQIKQVKLPDFVLNNLAGIMMQSINDELVLIGKYSNLVMHYENGTFTSTTITTDGFVQNISTGNRRFWLSTTNGFAAYSKNVNQSNKLTVFLSGNNVSDVLEDNAGHLWVSTLDKGIRFVPDLDTKFFYTNYSPVSLHSLSGNKIMIGTDQENLLSCGIDNFVPKTMFAGRTNHAFYMMYADTVANRIFATSNAFKLFDLKGNLKSETSIAVKDMVKIEDDVYAYSATWQCGLLKFGSAKSEWDSVFTTSADITKNNILYKPVISNVRGKSVAYKPDWNAIYFSTNKGLQKITRHKIIEIKLDGASMNVVKLVAVSEGVLALTANSELYVIAQSDSVRRVDTKTVLMGQSPVFLKMLCNTLFVFTKNSIYEFDLKYNKAHKIISINDDFEWYNVALYGKQLMVSTNKGFIITSLTNKIHYAKPVFVIDSIRAGSKTVYSDSLQFVEAINSKIKVYFSHATYNPDNRNSVYYRINNGEWSVISDNRNLIDFGELKPGDYQIDFKYGNGFLNSDISELRFEVDKPFWLKWWFVLIAVSLLFFVIYKFDKWRTARINQKSQEIIDRIELEKTANQSKLKALKSQMNPHFFFNALNTIQSFILENDKKMAVSILSKFSVLTRSMLEMSDKEEVSVDEEIKVLQLYLDIEKVRFNDDFEYEISTNGFEPDSFKIQSLLLQPYVENAIKHGLLHKEGLKRLLISFTMQPAELLIVIDDNGIGRKRSFELNAIKNKKHSSFATQAIEKRVKLLNEFAGRKITVEYMDEEVEDGRVHGTTVVIKIPKL